MKYCAHIKVLPHKELLDPQGKAVLQSLHQLSFVGIEDVRIGKHITLDIEAPDADHAFAQAEDACKKLLYNPVMESYTIEITPLN